MKSLIVLRHAKSNWDANYDGDINRPITDAAQQRARSTGAMLQTRGIDIDYALVSPALRTQQTFENLIKGYDKTIAHQIQDEIYHGNLEQLLSILQNTPDTYQSVMMVGHEPTCSFFTEQLLKKVQTQIIFKTASIAKIDFELESWSDVNWLIGSLDFIDRVG